MTPAERETLKIVLRHMTGIMRHLGGIYEAITRYISIESLNESAQPPDPPKIGPAPPIPPPRSDS